MNQSSDNLRIIANAACTKGLFGRGKPLEAIHFSHSGLELPLMNIGYSPETRRNQITGNINMSHSVTRIAAMLATSIVCMISSVHAQTTLSLGHGAAPGNPRSEAALKFVDLVKAKSGGKITVEIGGTAQHGDEVAMLSSLATGKLDMSINSQGPAGLIVPELTALGLPYAFSSSAKALEALDGEIGQELAKKFEAKGMVLVAWMDNGIRQMTNNKRPINKPEDVKGLRIRTTADKSTMDLVRALEATPLPINFGDLYVALQQGFVDGQENPLANIHSAKLHEVQKFISITNHKFESTPFLISSITWKRLSSDERAVIKESAQEAAALQRKLMADSDSRLLAEYKKMSSVQINNADVAAFKAATQKVWDNWELKPFGGFVKKLRTASN